MRRLLLFTLLLLAGCASSRESITPIDGLGEDWSSGYVETDGVRLHYIRTGGNKPPIVLSHGITDAGLHWSTLAEALEEDYDVIMYDVRGHGLSDAPASGYEIEEHVADLVGLIEELELEDPVLMGHSMGGGIVAATAARHPDLPSLVILEDPVHMGLPRRWSGDEREEQLQGHRNRIAERNAMSRDDLVALCRERVHANWADPRECVLWAVAKKQVSPNIAPIWGNLPSLRESFPSITAPTLILKADADDDARLGHAEAVSLLPDGEIVYVEGAGHNVRRDAPQATIEALRTFMEAHEADD